MTKDNSYQLLKDTYQAINRLEEKVDKRMYELECRVDKLESFRAGFLAVVSFIGIFTGAIGSYIWSRIVGKE